MLIYRPSGQAVCPAAALAEIGEALVVAAAYDDLVAVLIDYGAIESGIADELSPCTDDCLPVLGEAREVGRCLAHALAAVWDSAPEAARRWRAAARQALARLGTAPLPASVRIGTPEGYAYYGVSPELYLEAARDLARARRPERAVCLGLRSIGTSLSAVVQAGLEGDGCLVRCATARPRGHPFDRHLALGPALRSLLTAPADLVLVVDEGPGISGSSFGGTAQALCALGIPAERIVLLPSWIPDPAQLRSESARDTWARHDKAAADFDRLWIASGRLARAFGAEGPLQDCSAGQWRERVWTGKEWPAVQPQHERRKYLAARDGQSLLLKFAGLGRFGRRAQARAERLADAGFTLPPLALRHGFLAAEVAPGRPLRRGEANWALALRIAEYLAYIAREFRSGRPASADALFELITVNTAQAGLALPAAALHRLEALRPHIEQTEAVALDARMLPHEWVGADGHWVKTDATDHHDDHFFPGPQDPAWDVAATLVEFRLPAGAEQAFLDRYCTLAGDTTLSDRLPLLQLAYLAFRLGYASLAADATAGTDDGPRWETCKATYTQCLRRNGAAAAAARQRAA
jgi:hypothetical protein